MREVNNFGSRSSESRDLLVTATEVNGRHGVGVFLNRLFPDSKSFVCVRSLSIYGGDETFGSGDHLVLDRPRHPEDVRSALTSFLGRWKIRRILCVPYYPSDFVHAAIAKEVTGAPLVTYVMDDQNVFSTQVDDLLVERLLRVSDLRLGISWELCAAYERKFKQKFELLPPVLTARSAFVSNYWQPPKQGERPRAAMIGNVWTAGRFRALRASLKRSGLQIDWYGNGQDANWLDGTMAEWESDGIRCLGHLPEEDLVVALASYPYILVPSGTCDEHDDNPAFSRLSLPSRILFLHARIDTPLLVLGSDLGAAGNFVKTHGTGICCRSGEDLIRAHATFVDPVKRMAFRKNICQLAPNLFLPEAADWIWESLAQRSPRPAPFNRIFQPPHETRVAAITAAVLPVGSPDSRSVRSRHRRVDEAYSKVAHLRSLKDVGLLSSSWDVRNTELTTLMKTYAAWRVASWVSPGDDVLSLGDEIPATALRLFAGVSVWRVGNPSAIWGVAKGPIEYLCVQGGRANARPPAVFQAVWSTGLAGSVPDDSLSCDRVAAFCDSVCATGGRNAHFSTAVAHRDFNWVHPLHAAFVRRSGQEETWPGFTELFADEDAFFMSAEAYETHWQPSTGRTAQEFGRSCWLGVCWNGPSFFAQNRRRFWQSPLGRRVIVWQQKFLR